MRQLTILLMAVLFCSLSAWSQTPTPAIVGIAVSQSNDFTHAKKMLVNDGYVYNESSSTPSCAVYEYSGARYADEAVIVKIYKLGKTNKVEKCVILVGQAYIQRFSRDLSQYGYTYTNPMGMSIEPFQVLYENGKYAVGERINNQGWFEATFFQWGQDVKFE